MTVIQRRIGLTGGIATGKTTVSQYLVTQYRLPILDADGFARDAVQPGSIILDQIQRRYGDAIIQADGSLHRAALGQVIFADANERQWLEAQIHPVVRSALVHALQQPELQQSNIVVLDIPLLFESQMTDLASEIWVVTCRPEQQLQRLMQRNGLSQTAAEARIASQWPLKQKVSQADVVIDNSGSLEQLYQQLHLLLHPPLHPSLHQALEGTNHRD